MRNGVARGFTLAELAVAFAVVSLVLWGALGTLSAQTEMRGHDETRRRLQAAVQALLGFAVTQRRLPCPALGASTGDESPAGGGACASFYGGFLPAKTIGLQPTDAAGYALDAWGHRIRYAVSNALTGCIGPSALPHFTSAANLKANGVSCRPNDIDICVSAQGATSGSCASSANRAVSTETAALVVFSTGRNGAVASAQGADELANLDANPVFVHRSPSGPESSAGAYDDIVVWVPVGILYARLIEAGVLP
jgi:type II secretory pathway pseudopilin PulG